MKANMSNDIPAHVMRAQQYGHPKVYPNSETIAPPVTKERIRVVEPSTRTEVNINLMKTWQERVEELQQFYRKEMITQYEASGKRRLERIEQGQVLDIDVK